MNEISEKYKKYLIEIKLKEEKKFFVTGINISNKDDDFLLLDEHCKILMFSNFFQIEKYIVENKSILDRNNLLNWARELKDHNSYVNYDLDKITQVVQAADKLMDLSRNDLSQITDFINIVGDYSYQVNDKKLIEQFEDKSIDLFKELYMNKYIWETSKDNQEINIENSIESFPFLDFKATFTRMIGLFVQQFSDFGN